MQVDPFIIKLTSFVKPLPTVADRVLYLARQEPVNFKELAKVIETDPALSTMVISLANSPIYGSVRRPIDSLDRAIMLLGQGRIIDSVMAYMTRSVREDSGSTWPSGDTNFWKHNISVAICARLLAEKMAIPNAQQCFIAGLIHDLGKLALLNYDEKAYHQVLNAVKGSERAIEFVELEAFGITHANLSGHISRRWKLPPHLMNAIAFHHDSPDTITGTLANVVRSANLLAKVAGIGDSGNSYNRVLNDLLMPHPRVSQNDIQEIMADLPRMVNELGTLILGKKMEENEESPTESPPEMCQVSVRISNGVERILLRYIVSSLGYKTEFGQEVTDEGTIKISLMDFSPPRVQDGQHVIDFSEWRSRQDAMQIEILDIASLRNWLSSKLEEIIKVAA